MSLAVIGHTFEYSPAFGGRAADARSADRQEVIPPMAGHRRSSGRGFTAEERVKNRRGEYEGRLALARGTGGRLRVLIDQLISAFGLVTEERGRELGGLVEKQMGAAIEDMYADALSGAETKKWWIKP